MQITSVSRKRVSKDVYQPYKCSGLSKLRSVTIVLTHMDQPCVCEVGTVSKISDCQPEGPGFKPRPGRGLNFRRPSFATPSVDRDVKPLV